MSNLHVHQFNIEHVTVLVHESFHDLSLMAMSYSPDSNAMLLPGRVPGYKDSDVKLLPSSTTKRAIWKLYLQAAANSVMRAVAYSTFTQIWCQLLPYIVVMKPMSDLCWVCQQNSTAITRAANRPEEEKTIVSTCTCTYTF